MRLTAVLSCVLVAGCAATPGQGQADQAQATEPAPEVRTVRTGSRLPSNDAGHVQDTSGEAWRTDRRGGGVSRGERMN